jgi:hypothetical protein
VGLQLGREYTGVESNKDGVSTNIFFIKRWMVVTMPCLYSQVTPNYHVTLRGYNVEGEVHCGKRHQMVSNFTKFCLRTELSKCCYYYYYYYYRLLSQKLCLHRTFLSTNCII